MPRRRTELQSPVEAVGLGIQEAAAAQEYIEEHGEPLPPPEPVTCGIDGCDQPVLKLDNGVWLNFPAVQWIAEETDWTYAQVAGVWIASRGDASRYNAGHSLHHHQPGKEDEAA